MESVEQVFACARNGLIGDRYSGRSGERHLTLIQAEHLPVIASLTRSPSIQPEQLRRNILVEGINLLALKQTKIIVGQAILEVTGLCHPCSRMEEIFGPGGYNSVRGHGGITARVVSSGNLAINDSVQPVFEA